MTTDSTTDQNSGNSQHVLHPLHERQQQALQSSWKKPQFPIFWSHITWHQSSKTESLSRECCALTVFI